MFNLNKKIRYIYKPEVTFQNETYFQNWSEELRAMTKKHWNEQVKTRSSDQSYNSYTEYEIKSWLNTDPWIYQR